MERKYGYIESPRDLRDYRINKAYKNVALPTEFVVQHSNIKDQGYVGSCVAHAVSEVLETKDNTNYSTGWIYGYRPVGYYQGEGMVTSQALKTINKVGCVKNKDFNVNVEMIEAKNLVDDRVTELTELASEFKVKSYARLNSINEIKQAIFTSNKPVLVAIHVGENGLVLDDNYVAYIPKKYNGGHQLVCYGWNETGLLIQNSWGKDWGNKGTFVLPYEYPITEAWAINFEGEKDNGDLEIIKPNLFLIRELLEKIIDFIRKIFNRK